MGVIGTAYIVKLVFHCSNMIKQSHEEDVFSWKSAIYSTYLTLF